MAMVKHNILDLSLGKIPMLKILLPYLLGITLAKFLLWSAYSMTLLTAVLTILLLGITFLLITHKPYHWKRPSFTILYSTFFLALGYGWSIKANPAVSQRHFSNMEADQYLGIIADEPIIRERSIRFPFEISAVQHEGKSYRASGTAMVSIARDSSAIALLQYGDRLVIKNKIQRVNPPFNPKEFDYRTYLENKNIWHQCYLQSDEYRLLTKGGGNSIIRYSLAFREQLIEKFALFMQRTETFQIAIALIFGYRSQIDASTLQAFSNTGTIHVLSVSGLHVGLVFVLLNFIFRWMDRFQYGRMLRCMIIGLTVWLYVILTGMAPPILRAGIMITFFLLSTAIGRKQVALNTLATSAFFILLFTPKALFDVGFQLSYMAMLGIFILYPLMCHFYLPTSKYARMIASYSYVSVAAQLFTLPFVLYYFGQFPNYFLLANLFISIPSTLVMYVGLALAFSPIDQLSKFLGSTLDFLLKFCLDGLKWIENLPYAVIQGIDWSITLVLLCSLFIASLTIALNNTHKTMLLNSLVLLLTMSTVTTYQTITKRRYSGWKLYNMRQAIAFANIDRGDVVLYSSYDSLDHPNLLFSVMPDLLRYSSKEKIRFVSLQHENRRNSLITVGNKRVAIVENPWKGAFVDNIDILLCRKNNRAPTDSLYRLLSPTGILVFDGSNGDKFLQNLNSLQPEISKRTYVLKNNFAYVWEGK